MEVTDLGVLDMTIQDDLDRFALRNNPVYEMQGDYSRDDFNRIFNRMKQRKGKVGARVGDFLRMPDGSYLRFAHDWGNCLQLTASETSGSFFLGRGYMNHSGSLQPPVERCKLRLTDEVRPGLVWAFSRDLQRYATKVEAMVEFRVYEVITCQQ